MNKYFLKNKIINKNNNKHKNVSIKIFDQQLTDDSLFFNALFHLKCNAA